MEDLAERHEREQAAITAEWMAQNVDTETRIVQLNEAWLSGGWEGRDVTNNERAARVLAAVMPVYDTDAREALRMALTDLRHACDLLDLKFSDEDSNAHYHYREDLSEGAPAYLRRG